LGSHWGLIGGLIGVSLGSHWGLIGGGIINNLISSQISFYKKRREHLYRVCHKDIIYRCILFVWHIL